MKSALERFEAKFEKTEGCWIWKGAGWGSPAAKYGFFSYKNKTLNAHRMSWMLYHGAIPEGMCVLHKCDNGFCVNPDHLELGDQKKNYWDAVERHPTFQGLDKERDMYNGIFVTKV